MIKSCQKDLLKGFTAWFETLVAIVNQAKDTSSLPKLEVSLRSGSRFTGSVIGFQKSENENLLMLLEEADLYYKSCVHLVLLSEIVSVSLIDPKTYLSIFSKERPIVSELELRRKTKLAEEHIKAFAHHISVSLILESISEADRFHVLEMVETLPSIFEGLCKDETDRNIVVSNVASLEIQIGKTAKTTLKDKHLTIVLSKTPGLILADEQARLLDSIEKAL